jgi:putative nucleotidyltransferase with HDIG domain
MMPREQKFTYEFQIGSPWREENLTAPFKFSILKTDQEYRADKDSILHDLKMFFSFDMYLSAEQLKKFHNDFQTGWIAFSMKEFNIAKEDEYLGSKKYEILRTLEKYYSGLIYSLLENVYMKGIIELPEAGVDLTPGTDIVLLRGNVADVVSFSEIYTSKSAYEFIMQKLTEDKTYKDNWYRSKYISFFDEFKIERYITPNVFYNQASTAREKELRLSEISMKKGLIQQGELIVSKGQIVTPEIYQVLLSLKAAYGEQKQNVNTLFVLSGKLVFVIFVLVLIYIFLYNFRRELLRDAIKTAFILFMIVLMVFVASTTARLEKISFYIIPFAILPIILRTFFDERVAVFVHVLTTLIIGIIAPNSYEFVVLNIIAGIVAIFSLTNLYHRSRFFISALLVVITYSVTYVGILLIHEGNLSQINFTYFANFGINGILILISFLLIYIFEKVFGFLSDTTLMELSDTNQPLLRKLVEIAPGTFQHSLQVANLSEEAIHNIGGNPLLVRTGALYHDIGKMHDPIYFIENQTSGINPHDNLEFEKSADIIINHVQKGVEMANKNKLPAPIIDFIRTHHGTSTVQYFYRSYIKKYPQQDVDMKKFSYPGPRPFTKEMAVLMMADSVEAASRSMTDYSQESISNLVEKIVSKQLEDNQFHDAPITYKDITAVKAVFKTRLRNIYHARISYPK